MLIHRLILPTAALPALATFYADVLGLPVLARSADEITLAVGGGQLTFVTAAVGPAPFFHVAFEVAPDAVEAAAGWLAAAAPLLYYQGAPIIDFPNWHARSAYIRDPGGNIIECIGRQPLAGPPAGNPFSALDLRGLSEIGLVVPDVPAYAAELAAATGLTPFVRQPATAQFTAFGTDAGLLLLVPPGRAWFPTTVASACFPLTAELLLPGEPAPFQLRLP